MVAIAYIASAFAVLAAVSACPLTPACGFPPVGVPPCGVPPVFPVALDNCGPAPLPLPVLPLPSQVHPTIEKPVIPLPACIPPPKTINNVCSCVKTVVKPQVYQQLVHVPSVQRYLETSHTPVVENILYNAVPINCPPFAPELPAFLPGLPALPALSALPAALPALPALPGCGLPALPGCAPFPPCF